MTNLETATIFFLPMTDRPTSFPPLKKLHGKFWHTGIITANKKIYECFGQGKNLISNIDRLDKPEFAHAEFLETNINPAKITSEITSGTDCAEYVARCTGLSNLTGSDKGNLWPEDLYRQLS